MVRFAAGGFRPRLPARHQSQHAVAQRNYSRIRLHRLSNDVCHHHPGAHLRSLHQPRHLQGLRGLGEKFGIDRWIEIDLLEFGGTGFFAVLFVLVPTLWTVRMNDYR